VHKNKAKRNAKIDKSQYVLRYNILTVKLQSVIRVMWSGGRLLCGLLFSNTVISCSIDGGNDSSNLVGEPAQGSDYYC